MEIIVRAWRTSFDSKCTGGQEVCLYPQGKRKIVMGKVRDPVGQAVYAA
jgi:hypothetical protein